MQKSALCSRKVSNLAFAKSKYKTILFIKQLHIGNLRRNKLILVMNSSWKFYKYHSINILNQLLKMND